VSTIGQATHHAKLSLWASGYHLELLDTYLLFGDPATNFQRVLMALDDSYQINEDTPINPIEEEGVLANDFDPEGLDLTAVLDVDAAFGTLILNSDGSFDYTPDPNFFGIDSFSYFADNGTEQSNVATVNITVDPINDAPVADPQSVTTDEDTPVSITLTGSDVENSALTFTIEAPPSHGTLSGTEPDLIYTPDANYYGADSFTFSVYDGHAYSMPATVKIQVLPVFQIYLPLITR